MSETPDKIEFALDVTMRATLSWVVSQTRLRLEIRLPGLGTFYGGEVRRRVPSHPDTVRKPWGAWDACCHVVGVFPSRSAARNALLNVTLERLAPTAEPTAPTRGP